MLISGAMLAPMFLFAQPDPPDGPVPIDGGIGLLLATAVGMGVHKYSKKFNRH